MSTSQTRVKRGKAFTVKEDKALCVAWLSISQDPVTGVAQKDNTFWNRIFDHYEKATVGCDVRTLCSIQNRWDKIRHYCSKYRGCLAQIEHRQQSGYGIADHADQAKSLFQTDIGKPFIYEHCWEVLKLCDKWMIIPGHPINHTPESPVFSQVPETPISLDSDQDPISHCSVSSPRGKSKRPPGQKATKEARRNKKSSPSSSSYNEQLEKISDRREMRKSLFEEKKLEIMQGNSQLEMTRLQLQMQAEERMKAAEARMKAAEDREQQIQDDLIMNIDTSNMSRDLQKYYQIRKDAIMAKALKVSSSSNFSLDNLPEY